MPESANTVELVQLIATFYPSPDDLGRFEPVATDSVPEPYRQLLVHRHHMTVTLEQCHRTLVDVRVVQTHVSGLQYTRQSLLSRQSDARIVQFGIMRVNFGYLDAAVRREIESQSAPLGRILIEHSVLREIELLSLWRVTTGRELARHFAVPLQTPTYGRTAIIHCDGDPAVQLLEIVAPASSPSAPAGA